VSDDAIDDASDPDRALTLLRARLDRIVNGRADEDPVDRALSLVMREHRLQRAPLDALLEGYAWDARGQRYGSLSELLGYCARVASSVGVLMTTLMGVRDSSVLSRAIDLGAAMQLTNIARDVGEDARRGRIYLPEQWLSVRDPARLTMSPDVSAATLRLLAEAEVLYARALTGVPYLPADARLAIRSAAYIYRAIGRRVRDAGGDGMTRRHTTSALDKAVLLGAALLDEQRATRGPLVDVVLPEAAFLLG
jgi:phytoene synthase